MKRAFFALLAVLVLSVVTGCHNRMYCRGAGAGGCIQGSCAHAPETCQPCRTNDPCRTGHCRGPKMQVVDPGPATGAVTYPYYTLRGPRDFLARNPRSIGP